MNLFAIARGIAALTRRRATAILGMVKCSRGRISGKSLRYILNINRIAEYFRVIFPYDRCCGFDGYYVSFGHGKYIFQNRTVLHLTLRAQRMYSWLQIWICAPLSDEVATLRVVGIAVVSHR